MADWLHETRPNKKTVIPSKKIRFRDVNCDYGLAINQMQLLVDNDLAINTQIKNLLSTTYGSEDYEPTFGSSLPLRIMEPINLVSAYLIERDTIGAISTWMNDRIRLVLKGAFVVPLYDEEGYNIELPYVRVSDERFTVFSFDVLR